MIVTARAVSFVQACTLFKFHSLSLYLCISVSPPLFLLVKLMVCVIEGIWVWISGSLFCFLLWQSHDCVFGGFSLLGPRQLICVRLWHMMFFHLFHADFLLGSGWISQVWISALDLSNARFWGFGGFHLCSLATWGSYHSCLFYIIRVWFTNHLHLLMLHVTIAAQNSDQSELEGFVEMSSCKIWCEAVWWCEMYLGFHEYLLLFNVMLSIMVFLSI